MTNNCIKDLNKVVITIDGGVIQNVYSSNKNLDVVIVDFDCEGADKSEYWYKESLKDFGKNKPFYEVKTHRGVYNDNLPLNIEE